MSFSKLVSEAFVSSEFSVLKPKLFLLLSLSSFVFFFQKRKLSISGDSQSAQF